MNELESGEALIESGRAVMHTSVGFLTVSDRYVRFGHRAVEGQAFRVPLTEITDVSIGKRVRFGRGRSIGLRMRGMSKDEPAQMFDLVSGGGATARHFVEAIDRYRQGRAGSETERPLRVQLGPGVRDAILGHSGELFVWWETLGRRALYGFNATGEYPTAFNYTVPVDIAPGYFEFCALEAEGCRVNVIVPLTWWAQIDVELGRASGDAAPMFKCRLTEV
jgi:hypothetical protein